jgi:hypothetical protein
VLFTDKELEAGRQLGEALVRFIGILRDESRQRVPPPQPVPRQPSASPGGAGGKESVKPLLVSHREAAKMLSISDRTLWGLTAPRGPIPCVRFGRLVRYSVDDLNAAISHFKSLD